MFKKFYCNLYALEVQLDVERCASFLHSLALPKLDEQDIADLENPMSVEELKSAVKSLNKGKSPGLNGLPPEFYAMFWGQAGPPILETINFALLEENGN